MCISSCQNLTFNSDFSRQMFCLSMIGRLRRNPYLVSLLLCGNKRLVFCVAGNADVASLNLERFAKGRRCSSYFFEYLGPHHADFKTRVKQSRNVDTNPLHHCRCVWHYPCGQACPKRSKGGIRKVKSGCFERGLASFGPLHQSTKYLN